MNTRAIIQFAEDGVGILDEYYGAHRTLYTSKQRVYYYDEMSAASFKRVVNLSKLPQAIIHLVPWTVGCNIKVLIYWKREQGRLYHD
jgi:hypothetical protein